MKTYKITRRFFRVEQTMETGLSKGIADLRADYLARQPANRYFTFSVEPEAEVER